MNTNKLIAAGAVALLYMIVAAGFVRADRQSSTGGFITLQGMMSGIVTLPVALPLECFGKRINYRSNWEMGTAILFCGALLFALSFGTLKLADFIFHGTSLQT